MSKETLKKQYQIVKRRTGPDAEPGTSSHVSRFGSKALLKDYLVSYIGTNPDNENFTFAGFTASPISTSSSVNTRDIPLLYLKSKVKSHLSRLNNKQKRYIYIYMFLMFHYLSLRFKDLQWSHLKDKSFRRSCLKK